MNACNRDELSVADNTRTSPCPRWVLPATRVISALRSRSAPRRQRARKIRIREAIQSDGAFRTCAIFRFSENNFDLAPKSDASSRPSRADQRGALRPIVTKRGCGMRWMRAHCQTCNARADGKGVWARRPSGRCQARASEDVGPSGSTRRDAPATVTQKPVSPGRARRSLLTPSRRECRCSASPVVTTLMCFFYCT
jgi:hypothetical protein